MKRDATKVRADMQHMIEREKAKKPPTKEHIAESVCVVCVIRERLLQIFNIIPRGNNESNN